jgi:hypothetical protein
MASSSFIDLSCIYQISIMIDDLDFIPIGDLMNIPYNHFLSIHQRPLSIFQNSIYTNKKHFCLIFFILHTFLIISNYQKRKQIEFIIVSQIKIRMNILFAPSSSTVMIHHSQEKNHTIRKESLAFLCRYVSFETT